MTEALAVRRGNRISDRYTLLDKLGAGGQGEVWRARDEAQGIEIALKLLSPALARSEEAWATLEREYAISSRLNHPGILKVYPPQREGEFAVLPMDLATGGDLRRMRGAPYLEIVPVLIEIAQALEHAHERGVIHRDLKPGNVLFDAKARVVIADFGIAGIPEAALREGAKPALSPFTASPQQLRGEPPSVADDIYGLGALAYELLTSYPPFYPRFELRRVLEEPVPDLKTPQPVPPQLSGLVLRMLAKSPQERPRSMRAVIDTLDAALNDTLTFEFERTPAPKKQHAPTPPLPRSAGEGAEPFSPPPLAGEGRVGASSFAPAAPSPWDDLKFDVRPNLMRLEPERARRGPWIALVVLAALAFGAFYWLPRYAPQELLARLPFDSKLGASADQPVLKSPAPAAAPDAAALATADRDAQARLTLARAQFKQRLASLESRAAGVWGGSDFAAAKARAAESTGAFDAGNLRIAEERLNDALRLVGRVEGRASQAHAAQIAEGERALAAGQQEVARQAFEFAQRIDPRSAQAGQSLQRVRNLGSVLPLLADAKNAETAKDYGRAAQDYSQALSLDPGNAEAKEGLARAHAAFGEDAYAKAVGAGFAALGAGRLEQARVEFEKARGIRPGGAEAGAGLTRVGAALSARGYAFTRQRAAALEAEERWSEALKEYEAALKLDPSLAFAQQGKARTADRAQLSSALRALLDEPERLAATSVREEAISLMRRAAAQPNPGPVLRSQVSRLQILLPEFDKPVRLTLVSDSSTQVAIQRVGAFGSFARREIELKPGKYTVVGTRSGYRDVRRDVTISPGDGQQNQTINVSCAEPI